MSEDYSFEDKMKSLFEDEREHPYDPDQWRRLDRRLKENDWPPVVWWQRWLPYGFLLLVGLLGWQLWQQQGLQRTVAELSEQLVTMEQKTQRSVVTQGKVVIVNDTIYRNTIIETATERRPSENYRKVSSGNNQRPTGVLEANYPLFFTIEDERGEAAKVGTTNFMDAARQGFQQYRMLDGTLLTDEAQQLELEARGPHFITGLLTPNSIQQLPLQGFAFPTFPAPAAAPYKRPPVPLWQRIKPKGYAVSVGMGRFKSWAYYGNDDGDLFGDLTVEAFLKSRLSLEVGAAYLQRAFERNEPDGAPDDLPVAVPLESGDELENISGNLQQLHFPIGLRYYAWESGRFQFHVGAGLVPLMDLSSSSILYEYENDEDEYYTVPVEDVLPTGLRLGGVYGRFGLKAGLGKRLQLGVSATAIQSFDAYDYAYQQPSWGRWRVGLGYRLK
ncbi:MAG: outer membrane beta-barrel protein [Lewinella sp.]